MSARARHRSTSGTRNASAGPFLTLVLLVAVGTAAYRAGRDGRQPQPATAPLPIGTWTVRFSPMGGATELVVDAIQRAQRSIHVQAYSFTSAPIARALVDASRRGVHVEVILDKSQRTERYSEADFLAHAGIPVAIDAAHAIAHNKVMIIDDDTVVTGSFNFTKAAEERNAENVLVIRDPAMAGRYRANWIEHRRHSEPYAGG